MNFPLLPFWAAIIANVFAQVLKPIIHYVRTKEFNAELAFASGGFPSSHTATVASLTTAVGVVEGFRSTVFAITLAFSLIVIYDAINVRYYAGKNIELTKQLIEDLSINDLLELDNPIYEEKMKIVLGHKKMEALGGLILGCVVALILSFVMGG